MLTGKLTARAGISKRFSATIRCFASAVPCVARYQTGKSIHADAHCGNEVDWLANGQRLIGLNFDLNGSAKIDHGMTWLTHDSRLVINWRNSLTAAADRRLNQIFRPRNVDDDKPQFDSHILFRLTSNGRWQQKNATKNIGNVHRHYVGFTPPDKVIFSCASACDIVNWRDDGRSSFTRLMGNVLTRYRRGGCRNCWSAVVARLLPGIGA